MFRLKGFLATILAINLSVFGAQPTQIVEAETVETPQADKVESKTSVPVSTRKKLVNKFETSRSRIRQKQFVKQYAYWYATVKLGLSDEEFWMVHEIWERESGWNWKAIGIKQSDGRAKGIPQVKWSKMVKSPFRQVELGFDYIFSRYGSVGEAYKFHMENGWY